MKDLTKDLTRWIFLTLEIPSWLKELVFLAVIVNKITFDMLGLTKTSTSMQSQMLYNNSELNICLDFFFLFVFVVFMPQKIKMNSILIKQACYSMSMLHTN